MAYNNSVASCEVGDVWVESCAMFSRMFRAQLCKLHVTE